MNKSKDKKGFPTKGNLTKKLCLKYFASNRFLIIVFFILLSFAVIFIDYIGGSNADSNIFLRYYAVVFNIILIIASIGIFVNLCRNKKEIGYIAVKRIIFFFGLVIMVFCLSTSIFNIIKEVDNISLLKLSFILPIVSVLINILAVDIINVINFVRKNYDLLNNRKAESYDLLKKSEIHIYSTLKQCNFYRVLCLFIFILFCVISFFGVHLFYEKDYTKIVISSSLLNVFCISFYSIAFISIALFVIIEIYNLAFGKDLRFPVGAIYLILVIGILFKFIKPAENDINNLFHLSIALMVFESIFLIGYYFMKNAMKNIRILNDYESVFSKAIDLVMIDEPADCVENLQENCRIYLNKLHRIFDNAATNVPITIALKGNWGVGKSSIAKTLSVQLSKINRYSFEPLNYNDSYSKKYFVINIDLLKYDTPTDISNYIHDYIKTLCKINLVGTASLESYLDKVLELVCDADSTKVSLIYKFYKKLNGNRFATMEELKSNFQDMIDKLLNRSKRQGIIIIVDDIDRLLHKNEHKEIYSFLKEFFNIYGIKILLLRADSNQEDDAELEKFINVSYNISDDDNGHLGLLDSHFNELVQTTAAEVNKGYDNIEDLSSKAFFFNETSDHRNTEFNENTDFNLDNFNNTILLNKISYNHETYFDYFDYLLAKDKNQKTFNTQLCLMINTYYSNLTKYKEIKSNDNIHEVIYTFRPFYERIETSGEAVDFYYTKEFIEYLIGITKNPRKYKILLRKAVLEKKNILQTFVEDFTGKTSQNQELENILNRMIYYCFIKDLSQE